MVGRKAIVMTGLIATVLLGCEDKKETNLYKAQRCINTATAATVNSCLNIISSQTSARSYVLRCSAAFISQEIDEAAIADAVENIKKKDGSNPTTPAIAALAMDDTTVSAEALEMCTLSGSDSLTHLANLANLATAMKALLNFPDGASAADIEALLAGWTPGGATPDHEALGEAVIASQDSMCNPTNGLFKDTKACQDINAAIAENGGDAAAIADALIAKIND